MNSSFICTIATDEAVGFLKVRFKHSMSYLNGRYSFKTLSSFDRSVGVPLS